jgi:hypothetical protein
MRLHWAILLALAGCAQTMPGPSAQVDTTWTFEERGDDGSLVGHVVVQATRGTFQGQAATRWDKQGERGGTPYESTTWMRDDRALLLYEGVRYDAPCHWLLWPLEAGPDWRVHCSGVRDGLRVEQTFLGAIGERATVTVPAGAFDAYRVTVETREAGQATLFETFWIDPDSCAPWVLVHQSRAGYSSGTTTWNLVSVSC